MADEYRVQMRGIRKSFSGVKALKGVDFLLRSGEIHALVGENGAGKSTLMKILSGAHSMDEGEIIINGTRVIAATPRRSKDLGVGIVYQEFELADDLTIAENIFIDRLGVHGIVRWRRLYAQAEKVMHSLGFDIDVRNRVGDISVAYKQVVEIAKALSANANILILDEPTAVLTPNETEKLFASMRSLREAGVGIVYISHRMDEVFAICDAVTVMRDGEITGGGALADFDVDGMVELMIGRKLSTMYPPRHATVGDEILRLDNLSGEVFSGIDLSLRRGEILGIFGLVGSGRTEIVRAVFGGDGFRSGTVYVDGRETHIRSPSQGRGHGIALIPENRKEQGLILDMPIRQNMTMTNMRAVAVVPGIISRNREDRLAGELARRLSVKTADTRNPVNSLSGGNQQKVVIAKWLNTDSKIVIMDEPTRGVDVGAKAEIYAIMNELAARGVGILMISSELNEIIGMCDRVAVIDKGRKRGELGRNELTEKGIMKLVVGGHN
ncbi:MAG: sugar ABC transporter ATP-binding protein [Planctomycetota bacterium]|nr:sugar ABC transporter ATP-binding protein [Planctomycetota bacterium]